MKRRPPLVALLLALALGCTTTPIQNASVSNHSQSQIDGNPGFVASV